MPIKVEVNQKTLIIHTENENFTLADAENCTKACKEKAGTYSLVVLDFSKTRTAAPEALDVFVGVVRDLESAHVGRMVLAHKRFASLLNKKGIENLFQCFIETVGKSSVADEVPEEMPSGDNSQVIFMLNQMADDAVCAAIKTYAGVYPLSSGPRNPGEGIVPKMDLAANVHLSCSGRQYSFTLGFPITVYLDLLSRITKREITSLEPGVHDWIAELVNVSYGQIKTLLNRRNYEISPSVPTIAMGKELSLIHKSDQQVVSELSIESIGSFYVEITRLLP